MAAFVGVSEVYDAARDIPPRVREDRAKDEIRVRRKWMRTKHVLVLSRGPAASC